MGLLLQKSLDAHEPSISHAVMLSSTSTTTACEHGASASLFLWTPRYSAKSNPILGAKCPIDAASGELITLDAHCCFLKEVGSALVAPRKLIGQLA